MILALALVTSILISVVQADCNNGWSSCEASIWVSPKFAGEHPDALDSYTPGDIRGPLEYEIKFSCRGRRAGYYADLDHGCKVWHYCNTTRELNPINGLSTWTYMHFSYACTEEGTRYDQVLKECIPEHRALVGCRESELYYPTGEYIHDVPVTIQANNRLVPVRCPQSPIRCQVQKDHIRLSLCPDAPGAVVKFYSDISDPVAPVTSPPLAYGTRELTSSTSNSDEDDGLDEEAPATDEPSAPVPLARPVPPVPSKVLPQAGKSSDATKTNTFRFRQTPAAAARKTAQVKGQSKHQSPARPAPPRRITVVEAPEPVRRIYVTDIASQQFEQSKVSHAYASKSASVVSRKTISSPVISQVKTQYYAEEGNVQHSFPFIASHQVIFPRRLTEHMEIPTIESLRDAASVAPASANSSESVEADFLGLPIGSTKILGEKIDTSFDCTGRTYGYYADVKNQCKVYHVCSPKTDEYGVKFYEHYSFVCAEGLLFDQQKLTCLPAKELSTPCPESENFFTKTAAIFREGNEKWKNKKAATTAAPTVSPIIDASVEPVYVDVIPDEPLLVAAARKSVVPVSGKAVASGSKYVFSSPSRILKGKVSKTSGTSQEQEYVQEEAQQDSLAQQPEQSVWKEPVVNQYVPNAQYPADNSANGQAHKPSITQTIVRAGGQKIFHNPRITQHIQSPGAPAGAQVLSHSPSIDQYIVQPSPQPSGFRAISHNPSITQYVSQPGSPSNEQIISHNPSITQYISPPAVPSSGDQVISHRPSINQYVAGPGVQIPADQRISHNPTISQYIPQAGGAGSNSQTISHTPTINQVITLPAYARPSGRSN